MIVRDFIRAPVRAIPPTLAVRLGRCRIRLLPELATSEEVASWIRSGEDLEVRLRTDGIAPHDLALELLTCLGEALWESMAHEERVAYLRVLDEEIRSGVAGEIVDEALAAKRVLLSSPIHARSRRRLLAYARASFAATLAEYVHALWHDVTVRQGEEDLPPGRVRARLTMLARWFPPGSGRRLFARRNEAPGSAFN